MTSATEVLHLLVMQDAETVTYRRLSRELSVHVNEAKSLMYDYYTKKLGSCHASFLVLGTEKSGKSSRLLVKIVSEDELADAKQGLSNVTSHIYSLERKRADREMLVASNLAAGSIREMADLSAVRNGYITQNERGGSAVFAKPATASTPKEVKKEEEEPASEEPSDVVMEDRTQLAKKAATSFFGRQTANKPAEKQEMKKETKREPKHPESAKQETAAKSKAKPARPSSGVSRLAKKPSPPAIEPPSSPASKLGRMRVEDMFDDDDDDDDFEDTPKKEPEPIAQSESEPEPAPATIPSEQTRNEAQDDMDIDSPEDPVKEEPTEAPPAGGSRRVRKRRKVSRVKHTKNSSGMLVSETVDGWESYSESEPEMPSKPVRRPAAAAAAAAAADPEDTAAKPKKGKGKPAANQRSLLSFFGKK